MVRELLPRWRFERVEGARVGVAHKPDPTMAIDIAAGLGVDREQVVYVGDTDTDMLTANAAGMYAVGALWGFRDADELRAGGASMLAQDPSAVARLFD